MTYAMTLMGMFQWGVRQSAEVENQVRVLILFLSVFVMTLKCILYKTTKLFINRTQIALFIHRFV